MATIHRKIPAKSSLTRLDTPTQGGPVSIQRVKQDTNSTQHDQWETGSMQDSILSDINQGDYLDLSNGDSNVTNNTEEAGETDEEEAELFAAKTPGSQPTPSSERCVTTECDTCRQTKDVIAVLYCRTCKQKLCNLCMVIHNRLGGTRQHYNLIEKCFREGEILERSVIAVLMERGIAKTPALLASYLVEQLGLQICYHHDAEEIEIWAPAKDVLELALDTVYKMGENSTSLTTPAQKEVKYGAIEWTLTGEYALIAAKLFRNEIQSLKTTYDVQISVRYENVVLNWSTRPKSDKVIMKSQSPDSAIKDEITTAMESSKLEMTLRCGFDNYYAVDCEIEEIKDGVQTLSKVEVLRPKQDELRVKAYAMTKERSDEVICHVELVENVYKLVIRGRDSEIVDTTKQEFLSLYCKECSACHKEASRVTHLDCKHVLCHSCVKTSACLNDGLCCPVCADNTRERTPVTSLQLQCIQAIDNMADNGPIPHNANIARRKSSLRPPQLSTKIPKYLLNKWKKTTGGLTRLKSLIENTYGFRVAGSGDNMKIYGQQPEILELAVQSLEKLNEKTPLTGISQRLADKCIEWRLRGDFAKIAQFLFNKELYGLKKKFNTVEIQAFTEIDPPVVDVKCGYLEYLKVKYEMEELENDIKNLYSDECIQAKSFYYNVKVKEYLRSKSRDDKVFCCLDDKSNVNKVVIRGRKKEHVSSAKEELLNW